MYKETIEMLKLLDKLQDEIRQLQLNTEIDEILLNLNYQQNEVLNQLCELLEKYRVELSLLKVYFCKDMNYGYNQVNKTISTEGQEALKSLMDKLEIILKRPDLEDLFSKFNNLDQLKILLKEAGDIWKKNITSMAELNNFLSK